MSTITYPNSLLFPALMRDVVPMKKMTRTSSIALAVLAISGLSGCVCGYRARPPTVKNVAKTWVGYTDDELMFFRLDLRTNGTGLCADVYLPDTSLYEYGVNKYRINRWSLNAAKIAFVIDPASTKSEPIYLKGTTSGHIMNLEVGGTTGDWSQKLVLRPEDNFAIPNRDTKQAIQRLAQQQGREYSPSAAAPSEPTR